MADKKTTDFDLVIELCKRNKDHRYDYVIKNAEDGVYHDFKSEIATPKLQLVKDLLAVDDDALLFDLIAAVKNGDYDEEPEND